MIRKILKYVILTLFVVNIPLVALNSFGATYGTILSYTSYLLLIIYYIFYAVGRPPNYWLLYLGCLYFIISGLQIYVSGDENSWLIGMMKFFVLMLFGNNLFREVTKKEMIFFLFIGALSVIANGFFFPSDYGRASGFYYNANPAGLACLFGYTLTYGLRNKTLRQVLQVVFTIGGIVTFSRTFIIVWILVNLFSIKKSRKNIRIFVLGIGVFLTLFIAGELFNLGGRRFESFKAAISNDRPKSSLDKDSRSGTWSLFYEDVMDSPILGNGYGSFQGGGLHGVGAHNTYLLIIGEAGIIPLIIFLIIISKYAILAWKKFQQDETLLYMSMTLALYFLTLHDFFEYPFMLSLVLFWTNQTDLAGRQEYSTLAPTEEIELRQDIV